MTMPLASKQKILLVEDDIPVAKVYQAYLKHEPYEVVHVVEGKTALDVVNQNATDMVILDLKLPDMDGLDVLKHIQDMTLPCPVIVITAHGSVEVAVEAMQLGASDFMLKPFNRDQLIYTVRNTLERQRLIVAERSLLAETLAGSVKVLVDVLMLSTPEVFGDTGRVRTWMKMILEGMKPANAWQLNIAAMLYPIGYISLPPELIAKIVAGKKLSSEEEQILQDVPSVGKSLVMNIPRLKPVAEIIHYQNKNFNGAGYPVNPVEGEGIPFGARLLRILKDLASANEREWPTSATFDKLEENFGVYDPQILKAARRLLEAPDGYEDDGPVVMKLDIPQLEDGDFLDEDILSKAGKLILAKGNCLTAVTIKQLSNWAATKGVRLPIKVVRFQS